MARYIDADKLIEERTIFMQDEEGFDTSVVLVADIKLTPTADVAEVKYAVWKEVKQTGKNSRHIKYTTKQCSACGYWNGRRITNYCPHCGAIMLAGHPPVEGKKISVGKFSYGERKEE